MILIAGIALVAGVVVGAIVVLAVVVSRIEPMLPL